MPGEVLVVGIATIAVAVAGFTGLTSTLVPRFGGQRMKRDLASPARVGTGYARPAAGRPLTHGRLAMMGKMIGVAAMIASCTSVGSPQQSASGGPQSTPSMPLSISNGTWVPVTLVINGTVIETVQPGGYEDPVTVALPALPWSVEARSPSGRVLSRMNVNAGDVVYTGPDASGRSSAKGDAVRVDLPCGRLDIWSGPPLLGPAFQPDTSLSCD